MYAVIMAGGSGTRLWPLSRKNKPKQFHPIVGEDSLLKETYDRLLLKFKPEQIIVSTIRDYAADVQDHLPDLPEENIIIEPGLRGNAAACGLVSAEIEKREPGASIIFLPADHAIPDEKTFIDTISFVEDILSKNPDHIITIGINPAKPDVNLGYIKMGQFLENKGAFSAYKVECFVEKPTLEKAEEYLESGKYLWNAGMFTWKTDQYLLKLKNLMPNTYEAVNALASNEGGAVELYNQVENISIDYGIIEKTEELIVVPGNFSWSDVGTWDSLLELLSEINDTTVVTKGNHIGINNENCLIVGEEKLIATIGLKDIVVIDSPDAILICDRNKSADVKKILEKLKEENRHKYL